MDIFHTSYLQMIQYHSIGALQDDELFYNEQGALEIVISMLQMIIMKLELFTCESEIHQLKNHWNWREGWDGDGETKRRVSQQKIKWIQGKRNLSSHVTKAVNKQNNSFHHSITLHWPLIMSWQNCLKYLCMNQVCKINWSKVTDNLYHPWLT